MVLCSCIDHSKLEIQFSGVENSCTDFLFSRTSTGRVVLLAAASDPCTASGTYLLSCLLATPMAVDPTTKQNDKSRKHVRNVASVVPVLPLLPSDKKWRKPSQSVNEIGLSEPSSSVELSESKPSSTPLAEPKEAVEVPSDTHSSNEADAQTQELVDSQEPAVNGLGKDTTDEDVQSSTVAAQVEDSYPDPVLGTTHSTLEEQEEDTRTRSRTSTLIANEVGEVVGISPLVQSVRGTQDTVPIEHVDEVGEIAIPEAAQVQSLEEDTQGSDPDNTSVQRSNTTGLTDYSSTAGESTLETVIMENRRPVKTSGFSHRQSEVAPEALPNGYSPYASRTEKSSHQASASVSSQPPRLPSLQEHLLFLATTKSASDLAIQLNQPDRAYRPTAHNVHSLFVMRSPRVATLAAEYDQTTSTKVLNLFPVRNVLPHAFDAALRFFYSDQTLTAESLLSPQILRDKQAKVQSLDYIMSYWIAGVELGLDPIKARAYEFVQQIIGWDTAEIVVKEIQGLRHAEEYLSEGQDKLEIRGIADTLLSFVAQLFVEGLNMQDFKLDPNAQVTAFPAHLSHLENRPNNPALSAMVFGSLPAQAMPAPSVHSVASAILLNMNYNDLQLLVSELIAWHGTPAQDAMLYLIHLREERREQIVSNTAISNKDRLAHSAAWDAAGWREFIHDGRLNRERVGYLLPTRGR